MRIALIVAAKGDKMIRDPRPTVLHRTMHNGLAVRNSCARAVILGCLLSTIVAPMLPFGIAQAQPVTLQPRQPEASRGYLDLNTWCADHRPGRAAKGVQAGAEQKRLLMAQASLAPGFNPGRHKDGIDLLRAYQQLLEQRHPDRTLAATYLALTSTVPITFAVVERTNALLCVCSTRAFARAVADAAEAERRQMAR